MSDALDWNAKTIVEFRANEGRVGGNFEGAPLVLVHHRGRKSGREHVSPMMYLPHETEPDIIYVFATKGGAPTNPDWYYNLTAAGDGSVERGTETYKVTVRELTGAERDRVYAEQARRFPGFAEYARQTAGVRTIPVLELTQGVTDGRRVVGIIGSGHRSAGRWLARRSGPIAQSSIANSRGPESLQSVVDTLGAGITAGTAQKTPRSSDCRAGSVGQCRRRGGRAVLVGPDRHRRNQRRADSESRAGAARRDDVAARSLPNGFPEPVS